jgi:hypothetical protein
MGRISTDLGSVFCGPAIRICQSNPCYPCAVLKALNSVRSILSAVGRAARAFFRAYKYSGFICKPFGAPYRYFVNPQAWPREV